MKLCFDPQFLPLLYFCSDVAHSSSQILLIVSKGSLYVLNRQAVLMREAACQEEE